eukprot:TRINITY_DN7245_c0_g1_i2.p1 TRINITY_DN7245_c0_g1~~TRINITY_DN7245_c0_g1_i2.p1  ORF type:complete len:327 (-),score=13.54 TRINITY_DN7245_c0_g1_i2:139-1119(-)
MSCNPKSRRHKASWLSYSCGEVRPGFAAMCSFYTRLFIQNLHTQGAYFSQNVTTCTSKHRPKSRSMTPSKTRDTVTAISAPRSDMELRRLCSSSCTKDMEIPEPASMKCFAWPSQSHARPPSLSARPTNGIRHWRPAEGFGKSLCGATLRDKKRRGLDNGQLGFPCYTSCFRGRACQVKREVIDGQGEEQPARKEAGLESREKVKETELGAEARWGVSTGGLKVVTKAKEGCRRRWAQVKQAFGRVHSNRVAAAEEGCPEVEAEQVAIASVPNLKDNPTKAKTRSQSLFLRGCSIRFGETVPNLKVSSPQAKICSVSLILSRSDIV